MKRTVSLLLSLAMLLALLAGCGGNTTTSNNGSGGDTGSDSTTGGTHQSIIRMTADSTPILDPATHSGNSSSIAYCNLYDTLVFPTFDGVEPALAESWEPSEDGLEYTFHLRKGVLFHDGTELTASDVVFTAKRLITIGQGFAYLYTSTIKDVVADDDYTVRFILNAPYGPFVSTLVRMYIVNEDLVMANIADGAYGEYGDYGTNWLLTNDAGSGPYKFKELVQNDYFLGERFEDWYQGWENENAPEEFMIIYGNEPATVRTMMATQQLEITDMWQSPESLTAIEALDGVELASYSTRLVQNLYFNCSKYPTDDVNFRRALACLVDYDTLIEACFPGSQQPAGPVSMQTAGHVDTWQPKYDLEQAKEYLAASAYADELDQIVLSFSLITENPALEKLALAFQAACSSVGIKVEISNTPWTSLQEEMTNPETTANVCTVNSGPQFNEAGATLESQFHTKCAGTYENCNWLNNQELDAMIDDAMATVDDTERFAKYADIQNYIVDEFCPSARIADLAERVGYQDSYIEWPAGEATKNGEFQAYLMGYPFYMPDISVYVNGK